jgi:ketosteroid isomerase-like protein
VNTEDAELAATFLHALEAAAKTGARDHLYSFLAADVEWVTPQRVLLGIEAVRTEHTWGNPSEQLDVDFEGADWVELADGRIGSDVRQVYRMRRTGEFAYRRTRRIELTVRDGKISRYELRSAP